MKSLKYLISLLLLSFTFTACDDDDLPGREGQQTSDEIFFANKLAYHALDMYYRWSDEIQMDLRRLDPETNQDPIGTVEDIRYRENGELVDRWTFLTDDFSSLIENTEGVATTFGFHPAFYRMTDEDTNVFAVITYVSKDSPADKAGLKRGDIICKVDGKQLTEDNFVSLFQAPFGKFTLAKIEDDVLIPTDSEVSLTAVKMYEDPVLAYNVFTVNDKQVAYLAYTGFDLTSVPKLVDICKYFKSKNATELILDLRYNGGGYVLTEEILASMLAPKDVVKSGAHYETEEYNDEITNILHKEGTETKSYFKTSFTVEKKDINTADANIGLKKIYALVSPSTASASESILVCLMPYMDITIIGENTHGKYCTGLTLDGDDIFKKVPPVLDNWGIYVMISVYKNSLGENPCIPNGLQPDYTIKDNPFIPLPLGHMEEPLTLVAVKLAAGEVLPNTRSVDIASPGVRIDTPTKGLRIADHNLIEDLKQ